MHFAACTFTLLSICCHRYNNKSGSCFKGLEVPLVRIISLRSISPYSSNSLRIPSDLSHELYIMSTPKVNTRTFIFTVTSENVYNFSLKSPTIFFLYHFQIILFCVCQISIHCFIIELQYNHVLTL